MKFTLICTVLLAVALANAATTFAGCSGNCPPPPSPPAPAPSPIIDLPPIPTLPPLPSPPDFPVGPNFPPLIIRGTPLYWRMNPSYVQGICGNWATVGTLFGKSATLPFGKDLSVMEALGNIRHDGIGKLYRHGTAAFLNSMVNETFPFSVQEVRYNFALAVGSENSAAKQANIFMQANEGRLQNHN